MANKKPSKSVLDYDPLAWLAEDDEPVEDSAKVEAKPIAKKVSVKQSATKKAVVRKAITNKATGKKTVAKKVTLKKTTAQKASSSEQIVKTPVAKKPVINEAEVTNIETIDMNESNEEDQGFGFFDDAPVAKITKPEEVLDEGQSFGFFDSDESLSTQAVKLNDENNIINLGAELTIRSVSACKELIDANISNGFDIKLAAGDLQKIDTSGLQLIYSLNKTLEKTSQSIIWESSNSIINDAALLIGMPKLLESSEDEGSYGFF